MLVTRNILVEVFMNRTSTLTAVLDKAVMPLLLRLPSMLVTKEI
jgi:hypothetical protein